MAHLCLYRTLFQGPLVAQVVSSLLLLLVLSCIFYTSLYQLLEKNNSYCTICIMCSLYTILTTLLPDHHKNDYYRTQNHQTPNSSEGRMKISVFACYRTWKVFNLAKT